MENIINYEGIIRGLGGLALFVTCIILGLTIVTILTIKITLALKRNKLITKEDI